MRTTHTVVAWMQASYARDIVECDCTRFLALRRSVKQRHLISPPIWVPLRELRVGSAVLQTPIRRHHLVVLAL